MENLFTLAPERIQFEQFWKEIREKNRWLIMMRYGAVVLLALLTIAITILENIYIEFYINIIPLWIITGMILFYNILFHYVWNSFPRLQAGRKDLNSMQFALLQICMDFVALMLIMYFTGGVETPLFSFFVFHAIIGSILLPGAIMNMIFSCALILTIAGALLECHGIIPHHAVQGLLPLSLYNNSVFLIIYFSIFAITVYLSIYLANSITKKLYLRERELREALTDLEDADMIKSKYVVSVIHNLKTPLSAVLTYLNMLLGGTVGELHKEHIRPIERSKRRLTNVMNTINDLLYVSQLKIESEIYDLTNINIASMVDEILLEQQFLLNQKRIKYSLKCHPERNIYYKGEYKLIKLALSNLISNACQYTDKDGKLEVYVSNSEDKISITIADDGIGIPESERDKIFNEFYRSSITKRKKIEGTGLGMTIVQQVVRRYKGTIKVESPSYLKSEEDRPGTQFIIEFPKE